MKKYLFIIFGGAALGVFLILLINYAFIKNKNKNFLSIPQEYEKTARTDSNGSIVEIYKKDGKIMLSVIKKWKATEEFIKDAKVAETFEKDGAKYYLCKNADNKVTILIVERKGLTYGIRTSDENLEGKNALLTLVNE